MAIQQIIGFEYGNSGQAESSGGTVAWQGTTVRTGSFALQTNPATTAVGWAQFKKLAANGIQNTDINVADLYVSFYFRVGTLPGTSEEIMSFENTSDALKFALRIDSAGNLMAFQSDGTTQVGSTGSTALSTNTWYLLDVMCGTGAAASWEVKINGSAEISGTGDLNTLNHGQVVLGKATNRNGNTVNFYYDDVIISDSAFTGANEIKTIIPTANGSTMAWTSGTNASDYVEVADASNLTYVMSTGAAGDVGLFDLTDTGTAGISGTIHAIRAMILVREDSAVTSSNSIRVRSNTTNSDSTARNTATTFAETERWLATDPDTTAAWTTGGIDALEVGSIENNAIAQRMARVLVEVAYTAAAGGSDIKTINGLAIASVKTINGLAIASVKTLAGLSNV